MVDGRIYIDRAGPSLYWAEFDLGAPTAPVATNIIDYFQCLMFHTL